MDAPVVGVYVRPTKLGRAVRRLRKVYPSDVCRVLFRKNRLNENWEVRLVGCDHVNSLSCPCPMAVLGKSELTRGFSGQYDCGSYEENVFSFYHQVTQTFWLEPGDVVVRRNDAEITALSIVDPMPRIVASLQSMCLAVLSPLKHTEESTGESEYLRQRNLALSFAGRYNVASYPDRDEEGGRIISQVFRFQGEFAVARKFITFLEKQFGHRISDVIALEEDGSYAILPKVRVEGMGPDRVLRSYGAGKVFSVVLSDLPFQKLGSSIGVPLKMPRRLYQHRDWYLRTELNRLSSSLQSKTLVGDVLLENEVYDDLLHAVPFSNLMFLYKHCDMQMVDVLVSFLPTEHNEAVSSLQLNIGGHSTLKSVILPSATQGTMHWRIRNHDMVDSRLMIDSTARPPIWQLEISALSSTSFQYRMSVEIRVEVVYLLY